MTTHLEETLIVDGARFELNGGPHLKELRPGPLPVFTYQMDGVEIEKRVLSGSIEYELRSLERDPVPECVLEARGRKNGAPFTARFPMSRAPYAVLRPE